jgi:hypothetical protein
MLGRTIKSKLAISPGNRIVRHGAALAVLLGAICAIISFLAVFFGGDWAIARRWWLLTHGVYGIAVLYLSWIILTRAPPDYFGLPNVKMVRNGGLLVVENVPWLSVGVLASIHLIEDELERLICVGEVTNVQSNGLVQIQVRHDDQGVVASGEIWNALERADKKLLLVKPGLFRSYNNG